MTATYINPVDPVIPYTEAARDIMNTQSYIMIWTEAILRSIIIIINVLIVSQVLIARQKNVRYEYVFDEEDNGVAVFDGSSPTVPQHSEEDVSAMGVADVKKTNRRSLAHDELSLAERLRRRIPGMIKIRRGFTIDSGAADHVMPTGWPAWI